MKVITEKNGNLVFKTSYKGVLYFLCFFLVLNLLVVIYAIFDTGSLGRDYSIRLIVFASLFAVFFLALKRDVSRVCRFASKERMFRYDVKGYIKNESGQISIEEIDAIKFEQASGEGLNEIFYRLAVVKNDKSIPLYDSWSENNQQIIETIKDWFHQNGINEVKVDNNV